MKEIGGYLELDHLVNKPYYENLVELNTGRNALLYLVKACFLTKSITIYLSCQFYYP